MHKQVIIDCFPESAAKYRHGYAVVVVDVIRATTSAITVAAGGGRCIPAASIAVALELKGKLKGSLLAGEIGGEIAPGFELNNSPADLASRDVTGRPVILLSSSGTRLICQAQGADAIYLACFRNYGSVAHHLDGLVPQVAVIGAGSRGEFREEDQMCCAWIARDFVEMGYAPANQTTLNLIKQWATESPEAAQHSKSADYLKRSGQTRDLDFILTHINDLRDTYEMRGSEVVSVPAYENGLALNASSVINLAPEPKTAC